MYTCMVNVRICTPLLVQWDLLCVLQCSTLRDIAFLRIIMRWDVFLRSSLQHNMKQWHRCIACRGCMSTKSVCYGNFLCLTWLVAERKRKRIYQFVLFAISAKRLLIYIFIYSFNCTKFSFLAGASKRSNMLHVVSLTLVLCLLSVARGCAHKEIDLFMIRDVRMFTELLPFLTFSVWFDLSWMSCFWRLFLMKLLAGIIWLLYERQFTFSVTVSDVSFECLECQRRTSLCESCGSKVRYLWKFNDSI